MKWIPYRVSLRLLSPLHIGWKRSSNLQQTRRYVPAKNLWGALIAQMAADGNYDEMKAKVNTHLRFSYFYPSIDSNGVSLWPWKDDDKFTWLYMNSYVSTALNDKLADRGYLHETEYIATQTRNHQQVYLVGYVLTREDTELLWQKALNLIQLGGERSSGWGKVRVEGLEEVDGMLWEGYQLDCTNEQPCIKVVEGQPILAHMKAERGQEYQGVLEPLIGRNTEDKENGKGFGAVVTARICWMPGTVFTGMTNGKFGIDPEGIWKLMKG